MSAWLDADGRVFNPDATVRVVPLFGKHRCVIVDDALADPLGLVEWAAARTFEAPRGYPYPGRVLDAPEGLTRRVGDHFALHARGALGGRRTLGLAVRLSLVTLPPQALAPVQWLCHRDRLATDAPGVLFAASVLYLFHDAKLGGTSFYVPRQSVAQTERIVADSLSLGADEFGARYGLRPGYMRGSNAYFERVAQVGAAWNRAVFYDGGLFHSADIDAQPGLGDDPRRGRLTLNGFFTCRRTAAATA